MYNCLIAQCIQYTGIRSRTSQFPAFHPGNLRFAHSCQNSHLLLRHPPGLSHALYVGDFIHILLFRKDTISLINMQHIINQMCGLLSEAIEPEANRRLLPPAPSPREGVWGWGNVGRRSPFTLARESPAVKGRAISLCGRRDSNPYAVRHQILSLGCLPIPTRPQKKCCKYTNFVC